MVNGETGRDRMCLVIASETAVFLTLSEDSCVPGKARKRSVPFVTSGHTHLRFFPTRRASVYSRLLKLNLGIY